MRQCTRGPLGWFCDPPFSTPLAAPVLLPAFETPLPGLLVPGEDAAASMRVPLPASPGRYTVVLRAEHAEGSMVQRCIGPISPIGPIAAPEAIMQLLVEGNANASADSLCRPILEAVQAALGEAERRQQLPDDYTDVTEGFLGTWKRWLKRKLLGNFKHAYVDVLSRQQSDFNQHVLAALQEVVECCATLDHAAGSDDRNGATTRQPPADLENSAGSTFLAAAIERAVAAGKADELHHRAGFGSGVGQISNLSGQVGNLTYTRISHDPLAALSARPHGAARRSAQRCAALEERVARLEFEGSERVEKGV